MWQSRETTTEVAGEYLGVSQELTKALSTYTEGGGQGDLTRPQYEAVELMLGKHQECCGWFRGFDWTAWAMGDASAKLGLLPGAQEHILAQPEGKEKLGKLVSGLSQAFALAVPHEDAIRIRDDVSFFQSVNAVLAKSPTQQASGNNTEHATRQIVASQAELIADAILRWRT